MEDKVRGWLESQGYPLEMEVARVFQACEFRVIQGEYYTDPETGVARETDVVASMQSEVDGCYVRISFVTECKSVSTEKPWVLFTRETRLAPPARVAQRAASGNAQRLLLALARDKEVADLSLFQVGERAAYGVTQAFTTGKDVTYEAVLSAAKAAIAIAADADDDPTFFQIAMPMVVTRARIFEACLGPDNKLAVNEISQGTLVWRNPVLGMPHTIVPIMRADIFESQARLLSTAAERLLELAQPLLATVRER
jgi:hypothetical protein